MGNHLQIAEGEGNTALLHSLWLRTQSAVLATQMARMALHRKAPSLFSMPPMYQAMTGVTPFRQDLLLLEPQDIFFVITKCTPVWLSTQGRAK